MPVPGRIPPSLAAEWILLCDKEALTQDALRLKRGKTVLPFQWQREMTGQSLGNLVSAASSPVAGSTLWKPHGSFS